MKRPIPLSLHLSLASRLLVAKLHVYYTHVPVFRRFTARCSRFGISRDCYSTHITATAIALPIQQTVMLGILQPATSAPWPSPGEKNEENKEDKKGRLGWAWASADPSNLSYSISRTWLERRDSRVLWEKKRHPSEEKEKKGKMKAPARLLVLANFFNLLGLGKCWLRLCIPVLFSVLVMSALTLPMFPYCRDAFFS